MLTDDRLSVLRRKHEELSRKVEEQQQSPASNYLEITALKKQKLAIKEEIQRLSQP